MPMKSTYKTNQLKTSVFTMKHQYTSMNLYHLTPKYYFMKSGKSARPFAIRKSLLIMELGKLRYAMTLNGTRLEIMET